MALYTRMRPRVYLEFQSAPLDAADPGDWIEVTELVKDLDFQHGRSRASDDFQPGSGRVVLDNRDSRFDPTNTAGPYYGLLKLRRKIRVDAYLQVYDDTDGSTVSDYDITIAFGWVTSWNDQWRWRRLVDTTVTWTDALGLLANHDLPDSVWDYRIKTLVDAGKVVAWYRWDDEDSVAVDASGNGNHGRYVIGENGGDPTSAAAAPVGVVRAGRGDPVIPQVERPGLSFGRMVAEAGQPATAPTLGWRFPCVVTSDTTALWGSEFTVETWVRYRAAYSLSAAGLASSTTARYQWLGYWGYDPYSNSRAFGFSTAGQPLAEAAYYGEFVPGTPPANWLHLPAVGSTLGTPTIDDNAVHHMVWTVERTTSFGYDISRVKMYVDGLLMATGGTKDINDFGYPLPGGRPMMIGFQHQRNGAPSLDFAFGLEIGDLVVYNETLSAGDVLTNYRAGKYGNLSASAYLVASSAADQATTMAGYSPGVFVFGTTSKSVSAGKTAGKTVVEYLRELARGEDALMWQDRYGELRLDAESWKRGVGPGATAQATFTDNVDPFADRIGYEDCTFQLDDSLLANSWSISYVGGTRRHEDATSIAEHGRYEQSASTLLTDPDDAEGLAQFRVLQRGTPQVEIGQITFPVGERSLTFVQNYCDVRYRVELIRTRPNGTQFTQDHWIESVRHQISGNAMYDEGEPPHNFGTWDITLALSRADWPATPFILDTSELDGSDVIWY
jgi:hypothetical protein